MRIIIALAALAALASPGGAHADDDGGNVIGIGFGTAALAGDLASRFEARSVAVRMRAGLRFKSFGAELDSNVVNMRALAGPDSDSWVATTSGPAFLYYLRWRPLAAYVRASLGVGSITGPTRTELVPCTGGEDCEFKEVTIEPSHPAYAIELSAGAQIHLARRPRGAHPVLWADVTVRGMRALIDGQAYAGRTHQLAVGVAYGRDF